MKIIIPLNPDDLGGESIVVKTGYKILADRGKALIVAFHSLPTEVGWFEQFQMIYCQRQHDPETLKAVRKATDEEIALFRIPLWIQGEEIPECCGQRMLFVGQINDNALCTERPENAKLWWHDTASFYVFTCPQCLGVKAVGQQY